MDHFLTSLDAPGDWFVLHTKSRQEKALADDLANRGVPHFLPLVTKLRIWRKRKIPVEEPLFPGYVFLKGTTDEAYQADRTKRVAHIIPVADQKRLHWELQNLAVALSHKTTLDPYPYLKKGVRVEVTSGPLRGLQGFVEARTSIDKLILAIDMLGRAVSVELHGAQVDTLE
jgi:transcriptional antiterminator NusG